MKPFAADGQWRCKPQSGVCKFGGTVERGQVVVLDGGHLVHQECAREVAA